MPERLQTIDPDHMNIGFLSSYAMTEGGVQDHIRNLAVNFEREGHHVYIFAPSFDEAPTDEGVIHLGKARQRQLEGTSANVALAFENRSKIRAIRRKYPLDIALLNDPQVSPPNLQYLWGSEAALNVVTFHVVKERVLPYTPFVALAFAFRNKIDLRIAVSSASYQVVRKFFPGKYKIIPNGVDTERFNPSVPKIERFQDGALNILFVGRLEKRKGVNYLLDAYARVKNQLENSRLIIVGDGTERKNLQTQVVTQGIRDVHFEGRIPDDMRPFYYASADIFCSPAMYGESFGIVLLEAMASGVPIIAGDNCGYSSLIREGENGFCIDSTQTDEFVNYLLILAQHPHLRGQIGENGRKLARTYDWKYIAPTHLRVYREKLREKGAILV